MSSQRKARGARALLKALSLATLALQLGACEAWSTRRRATVSGKTILYALALMFPPKLSSHSFRRLASGTALTLAASSSTGREKMGSPTLLTLQDPISLLPWVLSTA